MKQRMGGVRSFIVIMRHDVTAYLLDCSQQQQCTSARCVQQKREHNFHVKRLILWTASRPWRYCHLATRSGRINRNLMVLAFMLYWLPLRYDHSTVVSSRLHFLVTIFAVVYSQASLMVSPYHGRPSTHRSHNRRRLRSVLHMTKIWVSWSQLHFHAPCSTADVAVPKSVIMRSLEFVWAIPYPHTSVVTDASQFDKDFSFQRRRSRVCASFG